MNASYPLWTTETQDNKCCTRKLYIKSLYQNKQKRLDPLSMLEALLPVKATIKETWVNWMDFKKSS